MLIQVYIKNEPLVKCDVLIARDDAVMSIPASELEDLQAREMGVRLVKPNENMAMKAAVFVADAIKDAESVSSPVFIACPDKAIMDGLCSMEYRGPAGGLVKCAAHGTKQQAPPRVRNKAKPPQPKPGPKATPADEGAGTAAGQDPGAGTDAGSKPAGAEKPPEEDMSQLMQDPSLTQDGEVVLGDTSGEPAPAPRDPVKENTPRIMGILKETGIPSGQIPGVLEALREAIDPNVTLPMQVKLKLAKDGAMDGMTPEETAKRVAPKFEELKHMLDEIDAANGAKP